MGVGPVVFGLIYFLFLGGSLAIAILALIALRRFAAAHQSLAQSVKELAEKLSPPRG